MAAATLIQITNYTNGEQTSHFIPDPASNILNYTYVNAQALEIWIRDYVKSPLVIEFPSTSDRKVFTDMLTMAITGTYYSYNFGAGGTFTPTASFNCITFANNSAGFFVLPTNLYTSATTTTTTAEPDAPAPTTTTTTTISGTTTTTTDSGVTTTTTLFPATLNWSYTRAGAVSASFRVYKNAVLAASASLPASGTITVTAGDTVYATITGTTAVLKSIDLTGGTGGTISLDSVIGATATVTLPSFTVARGNNYHIDGVGEPNN
jgi:hypothetical protein